MLFKQSNFMKKKVLTLFTLLILFIFCNNTLAQDASDIKMETRVGFSDNYVPGNWIPISIIITNNGDTFKGRVIITTRNENVLRGQVTETEYQIPVEQPASSKKIYRKTIYYKKDYFSVVSIKLISEGHLLNEKEINLKRVYQDQKIIVVNDRFSGFGFLTAVADQDRSVLYQEVGYLPADWLGYQGIDLIILDKADYSILSRRQKEAIYRWLEMGHTVIISGEGNYQTYNNDFFQELFSAGFIRKENIEFQNIPASIWQISSGDYQVFKKTNNTALALRREYSAGQVIFSLVDFQNPDIKEMYYEELIKAVNSIELFPPGFLDLYVEDMFSSIRYHFLEYYQVFLLLMVLILLISYLVYQYLYKGNIKFAVFVIMFFIVIASYSGLLYKLIYQPVIMKNDVLSEIAVVNLIPGSNQAFVEDYVTFQGLKSKEIEFYVDRNRGSMTSFSREYTKLYDENLSFLLNDDVTRVHSKTNGKKIVTGFRSYYKAQLPIYFRLLEGGEGPELQLINKSDFTIDSLFVKYGDKWLTFYGVSPGMMKNYRIKDGGDAVNRMWYYWYAEPKNRSLLPDNVTRRMMNKVLEGINFELKNMELKENSIYILGVIVDDNFAAIETDVPVYDNFVGVFKTYIDDLTYKNESSSELTTSPKQNQ